MLTTEECPWNSTWVVMYLVSPLKGSIRFSHKGKLAPRFIGPFESLQNSDLSLIVWPYPHLYKVSMIFFMFLIYTSMWPTQVMSSDMNLCNSRRIWHMKKNL